MTTVILLLRKAKTLRLTMLSLFAATQSALSPVSDVLIIISLKFGMKVLLLSVLQNVHYLVFYAFGTVILLFTCSELVIQSHIECSFIRSTVFQSEAICSVEDQVRYNLKEHHLLDSYHVCVLLLAKIHQYGFSV